MTKHVSSIPEARWHRGKLTAYVASHQTVWELVMAVLALAYLAVGFLTDSDRGSYAPIVTVLAVVFLLEFSARLWDAPSRKAYVRGHWLDAVSCIPLVGGLRSLRLLRLLRLGAALRLIQLTDTATAARATARESLWFLGPTIVVVWFGAAAAYFGLEHGTNPNVHTYADALYWAFITVTTVGYGDVTPMTPEGRILAGVLVFLGIGLVGFLSARLTSHWLRPTDRVEDLHVRMTVMEQHLVEIRAMLAGRGDVR